ncbi:hypothetical protein AQI88_08810 [Streptomyces cellostaticus]|uniref:Uncharacterized protein n=1 Tax=Streptomyces cellostaticus TaxID=67285 RepID=A0A101NQ17_9ACTN|nr:hypothetical protein [Streptomyces cellostaticus]KUM97099.1 hypothetical protein AQI88_08810 [Streptomyces cellostaticus]GHI03834.1 hypothetical protein Scel_21550 [Streptomyces cellostaticus]
MVTESTRAISPARASSLDQVVRLRADADLMDGCARRLLATASALSGCAAAPESSRPALERQAAACTTAAEQLRAAAEALLAHVR